MLRLPHSSTRPAPWPEGTERHILDRLDSTNATAMAMAQRGNGQGWVLALEQTAGKGRRGRAWITPPGNFTASALFWPRLDMADLAQMSFVAALALRDALAGFLPETAAITLKWPNDVQVDGRKIAGILLETTTHQNRTALVVGIGVNLAAAPPAAALEPRAVAPIALADIVPASPTPPEFLDHLAPDMARWMAVLEQEGFAPIRRAWLEQAHGLDQPMTARLPGRDDLTGLFRGIDQTGALIIETANGTLALAAADVYFEAERRGDGHASGD